MSHHWKAWPDVGHNTDILLDIAFQILLISKMRMAWSEFIKDSKEFYTVYLLLSDLLKPLMT